MADPRWAFALRGEGTETLELDIYDTIGEAWFGEGVSAKSVRACERRCATISSKSEKSGVTLTGISISPPS